jgi:hypothetical protein
MHALLVLGAIVAGLVILDLLAHFRGVDSRDGPDWSPPDQHR